MEYYEIHKNKGDQYEDFIADKLSEILGINITNYKTREYNLKNENRQGIEIKYDDNYKTTKNLFIETNEKTNIEWGFVPSGIYREDNSWLYLIGDFKRAFIFDKGILVKIHQTKRMIEAETPTSKGFLLTEKIAINWASKILEF